MPFKEHRGGGKSQVALGDMRDVWNTEWSGTAPDPEKCRTAQSWPFLEGLLPGRTRVLEAGCGQGQWVKFLCDEGYDAVGIDYATVGIEQARETWPELGDRFQVGDLRLMPFPDASFDAVVSFGAIEHNEEGIDRPLQEMMRVLKPGGLLYCSVPCYNHLRRSGYAAAQDWAVRSPALRKMTGRSTEFSFFEYLFEPHEYVRAIHRTGFEHVTLIPLGRMDLPKVPATGPVATALDLGFVRWPWSLTHMMAAVCTKPTPKVVDRASVIQGNGGGAEDSVVARNE